MIYTTLILFLLLVWNWKNRRIKQLETFLFFAESELRKSDAEVRKLDLELRCALGTHLPGE